MRSSTVLACDWLGEMPAQDRGAEPVLQIRTYFSDRNTSAFYMDPVDPCPQPGDAIAYDIATDLGLHHEVEWNGRRIRQRGYSFDPDRIEGIGDGKNLL